MNVKKCDQCKSAEASKMATLVLSDPQTTPPRRAQADLCSEKCASAWTAANWTAPAAAPAK